MRSKIYELCRESGISHNELARRCGITRRALDKYAERGLDNAQFGIMVRVARVLGCRAEDLFEDEERGQE